MIFDDDAQGAAHHQDLLQQQELIEMDNNKEVRSSMGFKARQQGGSFKPLDAGVYAGVCTMLVDVGMQPGGQYNDAYKVVLGFELPGAPERDDGKQVTISTTLTNSMDKKANLRKFIESWFGKGFPSEEIAKEFDLSKLLGKVALVSVTHKERQGKVYANITGLTQLPKEMPAPTAKGETLFYTEEMPTEERSKAYAALPEWIRKKVDDQIRPETEVKTPAGVAAGAVDGGDDIPF